MTDSELHYNRVARALHWGIGGLIIVNLVLGIGHDPLGKLFPAMPVHKSIGLAVLVLSVLRLVWRLTHSVPPMPASMPGWEKKVGTATHWVLYALMLILPLTGWIMSSAGDRPLSWFWLFDIPKFAVSKGDAIVEVSHEGHEILGYLMAVLVVGHVGAALRHHFILKDNVLVRMLRAG